MPEKKLPLLQLKHQPLGCYPFRLILSFLHGKIENIQLLNQLQIFINLKKKEHEHNRTSGKYYSKDSCHP